MAGIREKISSIKERVMLKMYMVPKYVWVTALSIVLIAGIIWVLSSVITFEPRSMEEVEEAAITAEAVDCGYDKQCFISSVGDCGKATLLEDMQGSTIKYYTRDCVLKKKIDEFSQSEPEDVVAFLEGRTMSCPYQQGNFNEELINGILGGIENCDGELKEAIYELRIAQFQYG